jgi:hypothetical protein
LDPDLAARIERVRDLILTAGSGSDGSGRLGARGGGAGHQRLVSAVARGSGSPDFANSGAPVAKSSGAWVWDRLRDMRNPPRVLAGLGKARGRGCDGGGSSCKAELDGVRACVLFWAQERAQTGPRACAVQRQAKTGRCGGGAVLQIARPGGAAAVERRRAVFRLQERLRSTTSNAKGAGEGAGAHRGLGLAGEAAQGGRRRGPSGGDGSESGKKLLQRSSRLLDSTGRLVVLLRWRYWGQEGRGTTGGEGSRWRSKIPAATSGAIPAVARAGVAGEGLGKLPGTEAELLRALAGSRAQQGGRSTVGQGALRGGASGWWR